MNPLFRPIVMSKSELALLYFPTITMQTSRYLVGTFVELITPESATNRLMRWIYSCPPLLQELEATGYHRSQKLLTSRQVALIVAHLGVP